MYEKGTAYSLEDLIQKFLVFAQQGDSVTQAWELVDDRLTSFYGATLKVPMRMWQNNSGKMPYFYISFQHVNVTQRTYADWLFFGEYILKEEYNHDRGMPSACRQYYLSERFQGHWDTYPHHSVEYVAKYGRGQNLNVFKNTGEFVAVGCHTHFDENLWMCEQGGITCAEEAERVSNNLNLIPARTLVTTETTSSSDTVEGGDVALPAYPGTGCPWFTITNTNKTEYEVATNGMTYWFTKDNYSATITWSIENQVFSPKLFQSMSFGMMEGFDENSYLFPLFVAGGNEALSQDFWRTTRQDVSTPIHLDGNSYDLDARNICLSNSNLLHPTKFNGSQVSNFRILTPEGIWRNVFNHVQTASIVDYFSCGGNMYQWGYPLNEPGNAGSGYHSATPALGYMVKNTIDTYTIRTELDKVTWDTPLQRVVVMLNQGLDNQENGVYGVIPNAYFSWSRNLPVGEVEIDGEHYLSIPNGWEGRFWKYPTIVGQIVNDKWENEQVREEYDRLINKYLNLMMYDRLLIKIGG